MALTTAPAVHGRVGGLLEAIDLDRLRLSRALDPARRTELGQFLTPAPIALQLATMFEPLLGDVRILDPGAGIGSLGATLVGQLLGQEQSPSSITLRVYELDRAMAPALDRTVEALHELCAGAGVRFTADVRPSAVDPSGPERSGQTWALALLRQLARTHCQMQRTATALSRACPPIADGIVLPPARGRGPSQATTRSFPNAEGITLRGRRDGLAYRQCITIAS